MLPAVLDGDVVLVAPVAPDAVRVGDIICGEMPPDRLLLHRVVRRTPEGFVTKGDALAHTEDVRHGQLLGRAVRLERRGRVVRLDTVRARLRGRATAALSPILSTALSWLLPIARACRRGARA
jgi:hypothetical protein